MKKPILTFGLIVSMFSLSLTVNGQINLNGMVKNQVNSRANRNVE